MTEEACRSHIQTHIGDKPFLCEDCGRGFVCEYNLKLHKRQHTGDLCVCVCMCVCLCVHVCVCV